MNQHKNKRPFQAMEMISPSRAQCAVHCSNEVLINHHGKPGSGVEEYSTSVEYYVHSITKFPTSQQFHPITNLNGIV